MCKHDPNNNRHRGSAYQEHVTVLKFFGRCKFKYECVVYACLSPHKYIASIGEEMQKEEAEHAAVWDPFNVSTGVLSCNINGIDIGAYLRTG